MEKVLPTPDDIKALLKEKDLDAPENKNLVDDILTGLSPKQKRYVLLCLTHPYLSDSERKTKAGFTSAHPAGLKKIDGKIGELLFAVGITEKDIATGIMEGLNAEKVSYERIPVRDDKGIITGYEHVERKVPDHKVRLAYIALVANSSKKYMPQTRVRVDHHHEHEIVQSVAKLEERERELTKKVEGDYVIVE